MHDVSAEIVITHEPSDGACARAAALAAAIGHHEGRSTGSSDRATITVHVTEAQILLRDDEHRGRGGVGVDWVETASTAPSPQILRGQPLLHAIGKGCEHVTDATGGLGHDALLMALAGVQVTIIERIELLAAMLEDELERLRRSEHGAVAQRLSVRRGDARTILHTTDARCIYLDPMYPEKRRSSALPPKRIRLVRLLAGESDDGHELLASALGGGAERVVVKRPHHAPPLEGPPPGGVIRSKLVRYDLYFPHPALLRGEDERRGPGV